MTERQLELWETVQEVPEGWRPMSTFPRDGTRCDVLVNHDIVVENVWWGQHGSSPRREIVGSQNVLSNYLHPLGWRPMKEKQDVS